MAAPAEPTAEQLEAVRQSIREIMHQPEYDDESAGPILVRLAWHSAGTYCQETDTGGSNGAGMRYEEEGGDPANAGLQHARAFLEPIKHRHPWITYADLWTLAGCVAISDLGGPDVEWRGGRTDFASAEGDDDGEPAASRRRPPPRGRLPDAAQGAAHLRSVFGRMGFADDRDVVALSGAHSLGRCHAGRSGFEGKWAPNPLRFGNSYFRLLLKHEHDWKRKRVEASGAEQFVYVDPDDEAAGEEGLMMLPTDMSLLPDPGFRQWVERYASDADQFAADFSRAFARLLELGLHRDAATGRVVNAANREGGYRSAPKKSDAPGGDPEADQGPGQVGHEARPLQRRNEEFRRRRGGAKL
ncbi:heme peroxidase [Xylariaceae sp. FL0804]|nr:heme peroxidase [Xylariaceae sp. FL0804]